MILQQPDGGNSLINKTPSGTFILTAVSFADVHGGTSVGFSRDIPRTTDGGQTWNRELSRVAEDFRGVSFPDRITERQLHHIWRNYKEALSSRQRDSAAVTRRPYSDTEESSPDTTASSDTASVKEIVITGR